MEASAATRETTDHGVAVDPDDVRLVSSGTIRSAASRRPTVDFSDVAVVTAIAEQRSAATAPDGTGGVIIAWTDLRNGRHDIYAQHLLSTGAVDPTWPTNGVALCLDARSSFVVDAVTDGAGGAIVVWEDSTLAVDAVRVRNTGTPAWGFCGVTVCVLPSGLGIRLINTISDGAGGAYVTWRDERNGSTNIDIFAMHLIGTGLDPVWPVNGLPVCTAPLNQVTPVICSDGGTGAIVAWSDRRTPANDYDIYAQHIRVNGTVDPSWPANGTAVTTRAGGQRMYATGAQFFIDAQSSDKQGEAVIPDGAGGCFITWTDGSTAATQDIYVHHVLASGVPDPAWTPGGVAVCTASGPQAFAYLVPDGVGGAIVTWADGRTSVDVDFYEDIYVQHIKASGVIDGPANGLAVLTGGTGRFPSLVSAGTGAVSVFWSDRRNLATTGLDVYTQHVVTIPSLAIDSAFPANGVPITMAMGDQELPTAVWNGTNGAIAAWDDTRSFAITDYDIYAGSILKITTDAGSPVSPSLQFALDVGTPNPFRDRMRIDFHLPREAPIRLEVFDTSGRRVRTVVSGRYSAGRHDASWDGTNDKGHALPTGAYLMRLRSDELTATRRVILMR